MNDNELHSKIRKAIQKKLRADLTIQDNAQNNQPLYVQNLARQVATQHPEFPRSTIWEAIYEMFAEGVVIPVTTVLYRNPMTTGGNLWGDGPYSITDSGRQFLESTKEQPDPYDVATILQPLRDRSISNETVEAYLPEASRALGARAFRGVFVLVGVAAEALSEEMYEALLGHLHAPEAATFQTALDAKKMSAEARWEAFVARFPQKHTACVGEQLSRQFKSVLEPQLKFLKYNRDDAAHRRATYISPENARAALSAFVPFGTTVADVVQALQTQCKAP